MRRVRKAIPWILAAAVSLVAMLDAYRPFLEVERPILHPEVIVVLGGEGEMRSRMAATWHRADSNLPVLITGRGDWPRIQAALVSNGIPATRILVETNSASTYENARLTAPMLASNGWDRVLLVTSVAGGVKMVENRRFEIPGIAGGAR